MYETEFFILIVIKTEYRARLKMENEIRESS